MSIPIKIKMNLTNKERIAKMEGNIENLSEGQKRVEGAVTNLNIKMDKFIDSVDTKYARKCVEEEFKEFTKNTDTRMDKIENKYSYVSGAVGVLIIIIQFWLHYRGG